MTHCRLSGEKCRSVWMFGSATFTIVTSSTTMNCAIASTTSVLQGLLLIAGPPNCRCLYGVQVQSTCSLYRAQLQTANWPYSIVRSTIPGAHEGGEPSRGQGLRR